MKMSYQTSTLKMDVKYISSNVCLNYPKDFKDTQITKLQECITNIYYNKTLDCSYQDLYMVVENLCTLNQYEDLHRDLKVVVEEYLNLQLLDLICYENSIFLLKLKKLWLSYCHKSKLIKNVYLYLEMFSLRQNKKKISVWNMCMDLFDKIILSNNTVQYKKMFIFNLIESERNGATIDTKLVKDIICMLDKLNMYESHFENDFVVRSEFYYEKHRDDLLEGNIMEYIYYVQLKLIEEESRVKSYLKASTGTRLIKLLYGVLIEEEILTIFEKLEKACVFEKADLHDIITVYELVVTLPEANNDLCKVFSNYMMKRGTEIVTEEKNETALISNLLDFKDRIDEMVRLCFKSTLLYSEAVRLCFKKFINQRKSKPAQFLAKYIDIKMRDKLIPEDLLDKIMVLFRYIQGKDVFEAYYKRYLSKRLLLGKSASQDAEKYMISKLKLECGDGFTSKLEGMFKDIDLSDSLMCSFKQRFTSDAFPIEFVTNVLTASFWPTYPKYTVTLSDKMAKYQTIFYDFYKAKYTGRSLQWIPSLGSCLIKASLKGCKKEFVVSLYQALVLCLFNETDRLTFLSIQLYLNLNRSELVRTLTSLFCKRTKLLIKIPAEGLAINDTDEFRINDDYKHKLFRVKINQLQYKENDEEQQIIKEEVMHDRHLQIDAALVRLMKQNQKLRHNELIAEIYKVLKFPTNPNDIKKRIEILIERDFLARNPDDTNSYYYVA